jgi:hypothetical protein
MASISKLNQQIIAKIIEKFESKIKSAIIDHDKDFLDYLDSELEYENSIVRMIIVMTGKFIIDNNLSTFDIVDLLKENIDEDVDLEPLIPSVELINLVYRMTARSLYKCTITSNKEWL